ncbi:S-acyl fatty acid synthase thioesterase, medium chain-like [Antedon mediterranea]|uniref:S-acyl fatty acid synthase thioesterase, medium chain-like n=1 Tax=Antedon mediterranea TaxID=105859 RepID=UPI003AF9B73E
MLIRMESMINCRHTRPNSQLRLFCFPWAGGGTNYYVNWAKTLSDSIEVCAVRLAGREIRLNDKPCGDMLTTVANIANTLLPKFQSKPFAFFGHSMGSVLSFEVALYLKKYYGLEPVHLFVSGFTSPQSAGQRIATDWINMPEDEFLENIKRIGGTPQEVLENRDLMKMYMPSLRADFHMVSHYRYNLPDSVPLTCPVSFTDGDNDKPHDVAGWAKITNGEFKSQTMPGGHFYFYNKENERQLLKYITEKLL